MYVPTNTTMSTKQDKLAELDTLLSTVKATVKDASTATPSPLTGVTVYTNVVSQASVKEAIQNLARSIAKTWPAQYGDTVLAEGKLDIHVLNQQRNCATSGFGNASFAYLFKQYANKTDYAKIDIGREDVFFDINDIYGGVTLPLLTHQDNGKTVDIIFGLDGDNPQSFLSHDSIKLANNPKGCPKSMTKQTLTAPHMDIYGDNLHRIQSIINCDIGATKLFFVPGTELPAAQDLIKDILQKPKLYDRHGYISITDADLLSVLTRHAVAAPPRSMTSWPSKVIHFEGEAYPEVDAKLGLYRWKSWKDTPNSLRLRFIVGTQRNCSGLSQSDMKKIGLMILRGFLPTVYFRLNRNTKVKSVSDKTTQKKVPRTLTASELQRLRNIEQESTTWTDATFDREVTHPTLRRLLGVL